jgi:HK97 family phage major capsid protein
MIDIKSLRAKVSKLLLEQRAIALAPGGFTTESRSKFDLIQRDVDAAEEKIADAERLEKFEQRDREDRSFTRSPRPGTAGNGSYSGDEQRDRANKGFRAWARTGEIPHEYRDLLTTSDLTGGAIIPELFSPVLNEALKFYGPIADRVDRRETNNNGSPMKYSYSTDVANGMVLLPTEGTSSPAETDPGFFSKVVGVDTLTGGLVKISVQELEDSSFDLDALIRRWMGTRYARALERVVTLGTDTAGTTLPNSATGGLVGNAVVGQTTAAIANGIGWDDLTQLALGSGVLDPAYAGPDAAWVMNAATRGYLIGLKNGFGQPYFTPDPSADQPFNKLLGWDIVLNQSMVGPTAGAFTANSNPILFGSLKNSYLLRTDGQPSIVRLRERYMDTLEQGFFLYTRVGGIYLGQTEAQNGVAAVNPVVKLQIAAS